ncbi:hypothetical protein Lalb_Chr03g0027761 [Lupinus albus]|uniref:Uncharacterized protein n=1 Tax=Lupinus albus TaxID=3870 RepID=A0A6A4QU02_LUPAL|nr:hypothetical protein Lalb_Chr03g0027761 [Lupinus albus]
MEFLLDLKSSRGLCVGQGKNRVQGCAVEIKVLYILQICCCFLLTGVIRVHSSSKGIERTYSNVEL